MFRFRVPAFRVQSFVYEDENHGDAVHCHAAMVLLQFVAVAIVAAVDDDVYGVVVVAVDTGTLFFGQGLL